MPELRISVVMPVLDEEARIAGQLARLREVEGLHEVIVVDGGSTDRTVTLVEEAEWCRLIGAPKGRGPQMNAGAHEAEGDVLLFLHADVALPDRAVTLVESALADSEVVAGAFRTHTIADGRTSWVTGCLRLADLRSRYSRLPYGDQALFVRREVFDRVGGFPPQPIFEDVEISRRLRRAGLIRTLPESVVVSGRRFTARPLYYAALMTVLPTLYRLGVRPTTLARTYGHER
jgi:rSAM/selenodomain-associated transferase 2